MSETFDLFNGDPFFVATRHRTAFRDDFLPWLAANAHIYAEFERLALGMARVRKHYGARSIVEKMRYDMAISQVGGEFKIDGNMVPCMARLFALCNPDKAALFEFREPSRDRSMGAGAPRRRSGESPDSRISPHPNHEAFA